MSTDNFFGEQLKKLRMEKGVSQQKLADMTGIHRVQIAKLEAGQYQPTWGSVVKLCDALGVSCEVFRLTADEQPAEPEAPAKKAKKGKG